MRLSWHNIWLYEHWLRTGDHKYAEKLRIEGGLRAHGHA